MKLLLVGAGGHARVVVELLRACGHHLSGFVDPSAAPVPWLEDTARVASSDNEAISLNTLPNLADHVAIGLGGVRPDSLVARLDVLRRYAAVFGTEPPALVHPSSFVGHPSSVGSGTQVMAGALINVGAAIGLGAIVNTGAVVEHDAVIGSGSHVAPRAIILGGARVGKCAMVGAGAVVLPEAVVEDYALVPALTRYPAKAA